MENNVKTSNDIDIVYGNTYLHQSQPIKEGENNLFTSEGCTPSSDLLSDGNTKVQGSYSVTDFIDIGDYEANKSLFFRLHIKSIFYDADQKLIKYIETPEYPEHVEIEIPAEAKYIRTVYCIHDEKILYIVKRDKIKPYVEYNKETVLLPDIELSNKYKDRTILYVDELGFNNTGEKDNSQALLDLEAIIERNSKWHNDKIFTIVFGSGTYLFEHTHMNFLSRKHKNAVFGLNIQGQGVSTKIKYVPKDPRGVNGEEHFFIKNDNKYANITFQNFMFEGDAYKKASFCRLTATPFPQHIVLDKVMFNNVYTTMEIKGCDCGSEIMFDHCKWNGINDNVLKAVRPGISSQFLNYWFINPDFQCQGGSFVNLELGGNVNIIGGNLIHKNTGGGFIKGGSFFKLGYNWAVENNKKIQSLGICRFLCEGTRFECAVDRNSRIIESYWDSNGSIVFINCDDGAKHGAGIKELVTINKVDENGNKILDENEKEVMEDKSLISAEYEKEYTTLKEKYGDKLNDDMLLKEVKFVIINGAPSVKFENCIFHGRHVYDVSNNNDKDINLCQNAIVYDGCIFSGQEKMKTPWEFIDMIERPGNDDFHYASHVFPTIKFINLPKHLEQYEGSHYKEKLLYREILQKKYLNLKNVDGFFPTGSIYSRVVEGKLITGLILYAPKGYSTNEKENDISISITTPGEDDKILFSLGTDNKLKIYGEDEITVESNIEKDGLSYNIEFKKPILITNKDSIIRFYRGNTTNNGWKVKDKIIALIEFI